VEVSEMTTKRESFLFWGLCLPFWESPIKMHYLSGFWAFLAKLKWWTYVIKVLKFDGPLCSAKLHQKMAEIAIYSNFENLHNNGTRMGAHLT
jgi:hypothetical protein